MDKVFHEKNANDVCEALNYLQQCEPNCKRGRKRMGVTKNNQAKYTIFGIKIPQHKGFSRSKVEKKNPEIAFTLKKWARRLEHISTMFVPSNWLRGIRKMAYVVNLNSIDVGAKMLFHGAMASNFDYCAPAHVDNDFKWSVHQLNVKDRYGDSEIAQYFCFPTLGFAVALRPGDVLLFNPRVHHCLSDKSPQYADDRVHVTTMYLKLGHVSGNDVDRTLTQEEREYLDMDHQFTFKI